MLVVIVGHVIWGGGARHFNGGKADVMPSVSERL